MFSKGLNLFRCSGPVALSICVLLIFASTCETKSQTTNRSRANLHPEIHSTAELRQKLVPGISTNELVAKFGDPAFAVDLGQGTSMWMYSLSGFPADDDMKGTIVTDASITITNGHLESVAFGYQEEYRNRTRKRIPLDSATNGSKVNQQETPKLKFYLVSDVPIANGKQIDTSQFPKLGYIPDSPNITAKRLKDLALDEVAIPQASNTTITNWQFTVWLTPAAAAGLASLTKSNVGKTVLLTVGDVPVMAPFIREPLETGSFIIQCKEQPLMETVRSNLASIEKTH